MVLTRGGRELDGKRQPVQPGAELRHAVCAGGRGGDTSGGGGSVREQVQGVRECERWDRPDGLAADTERLAARRDDPQLRAAGKEVLHDARGLADEVLAVVDHEECLPVAKLLDHSLERWPCRTTAPRPVVRPERRWLPRPPRPQLGDRPGGQLDEEGVRVGGSQRQLVRESRLPRPTGADDRHQAMAVDQLAEGREIAVAPDEAAERRVEVRTPPR